MLDNPAPALLAQVIAHRGASGDAPENTIAALSLAINQGAYSVEIDVSISSDHVPFVHHDDTLDRCTNGSGLLSEHEASALDKLDASNAMAQYSGEPLPRLEAVITLLKERGVGLNLEIKPQEGLEAPTVEAICRTIETHWPAELPLVFSSFSQRSLELAFKRLPDVPRALLLEEITDDWHSLAKSFDCLNIHCDGWRLTSEQADAIKKQGYYLYCYTVNDPEKAKSLLSCGVDGVFTDYPALMLNSLKN